MLDLGWSELLIVAVAALIIVGPKDLPRMLRTLGQYAAKAKGVAREFQRSMDDAARQADIDELRQVKKDLDGDVTGLREAQYKMQRDMSQSFLDEPKDKAKGAPAAATKTPAGEATAPESAETPAASESAASESAASESATSESATSESATSESATSESATSEAGASEPAAPEPPPRKASGA